jgi:hypothetical protein
MNRQKKKVKENLCLQPECPILNGGINLRYTQKTKMKSKTRRIGLIRLSTSQNCVTQYYWGGAKEELGLQKLSSRRRFDSTQLTVICWSACCGSPVYFILLACFEFTVDTFCHMLFT